MWPLGGICPCNIQIEHGWYHELRPLFTYSCGVNDGLWVYCVNVGGHTSRSAMPRTPALQCVYLSTALVTLLNHSAFKTVSARRGAPASLTAPGRGALGLKLLTLCFLHILLGQPEESRGSLGLAERLLSQAVPAQGDMSGCFSYM
jgi:hypothetical protein